jgi:hypothetical protein
MEGALAQAVSPELALVCPELAASARAALPDRDPYAYMPRRPRADPRAAHEALAAALAYAAFSLLALGLRGVVWVVLLALIVTGPLVF